MLTVAYVYQMKSLQKKRVIDVQQVKAVKPNDSPPPFTNLLLLTTQMSMDGG